MTETKKIDGILPCMTNTNCPLAYACGGKLDYSTPNTKKLACLLTHIEMLANELYKRDEPNHNCTIGDYAYQMAWVMHNEILTGETNTLTIYNAVQGEKKGYYAIYNTSGWLIERKEIIDTQQQIETPLTPGIYIIHIYYDTQIYTRKVIVR